MKEKGRKTAVKREEVRKVDQYFSALDKQFTTNYYALYAIFLFLLFFGIQGLIWMIPFPQFDFLVRMNMHTFLNWGSFYIAIMIYLYLKLAPTLSYAMLFSVGVMSYFIVQLEYYERDGGAAVWHICAVLAIVGLFGLILLTGRGKVRPEPKDFWQLITLGPVWIWAKVFRFFKIKY